MSTVFGGVAMFALVSGSRKALLGHGCARCADGHGGAKMMMMMMMMTFITRMGGQAMSYLDSHDIFITEKRLRENGQS